MSKGAVNGKDTYIFDAIASTRVMCIITRVKARVNMR